MAPLFDASTLVELAAFGEDQAVDAGQVLYRAGDASYDFYVVLDGRAEIVRAGTEGDTVIASYGAAGFLGELNLLTGQRPYLTARVTEPGRVLRIRRDDFRRLMSEKPDIADLIFNAFSARREILLKGDGAQAIRIVGRGTLPTPWRCGPSPPDRISPTYGSISKRPRIPRCFWPVWGYGRPTRRR